MMKVSEEEFLPLGSTWFKLPFRILTTEAKTVSLLRVCLSDLVCQSCDLVKL